MKIKKIFGVACLAVMALMGCSRLKEGVSCNDWSSLQGGERRGSSWKECADGKSYTLHCDKTDSGWNCRCDLNGQTVKTVFTSDPLEGEREFWTKTTQRACGWNLSL